MTKPVFWVADVVVKISCSFVKCQTKRQIGLGNRAALADLLHATPGIEVAVLRTKRLYTKRVFQRFDGLEPANGSLN